ncbi:hypothetical protein EHM69_03950, partial [candidate division KSB1 bacterium]
MILAGCALPEAPGDYSWDTHLTVPFGIRTYGLIDLVDSSEAINAAGSGVGMDDDSLLYYAAFTDLEIPMYDSLTIEPITDTLFKPAWVTDTTSFYTVVNQRHRLIQGTIETGTVTVSARNISDVPDTVRVTFPNMLNPLGEWLVIKRFVAAQSQSDTTWNLTGYRISLTEDIPQSVEIRLHASEGSQIHAVVNTSRFLFRYYTGVLAEQELESFASGRSVDLPPEGWESVHPTEVEALIHVEHGVNGLLANISTNVATYLSGLTLASANLNASGVNLGRDTSAVVPDLLQLLQIYP